MPKKTDTNYKFNTKRKNKWLRLYRQRGTVSAACYGTRISRGTYYHAMKNDSVFAEKKHCIDEGIYDEVEKSLFEIATGTTVKEVKKVIKGDTIVEETITEKELAPNIKAINTVLNNNRSDQYKDRQNIDHTITDKRVSISYEPFDTTGNQSEDNESIQEDGTE